MIIDTHAHYDDGQFDIDREELLTSMEANGITRIVNVGADMDSSRQTVALTEKYSFLYGAVGVHPNSTAELSQEKIIELKKMAQLPKIVAIGEIGLDYYWDEPEPSVQKQWFDCQMDLAREVKLPMIIHSRDAAKDTIDMMKAQKAGEIGGVIHCYSYSVEMAREYLNMGFFLGIGGVVTFKNAKTIKEVVSYAPIEALVLETDCPYLAPEPNRGKRNSSKNIPYVVQEIARLKDIDVEKVIAVTEKNARSLYPKLK
ncbi:TatD family hydrolase [Anaerosporobacter faecicola]|uniref:TatD family hydrolase n=1 Tax=Anaerosporobacter faecicola TaxID=2718714 RepID=UPI001439CA93|nr:TatD family hydrolase [Anaerosporobacter faecicola]